MKKLTMFFMPGVLLMFILTLFLFACLGQTRVISLSKDTHSQAGSPALENGKLDINQATATELTELPGIGDQIASEIMNHREQNGIFKSTDELMEIPGIGPSVIKKLLPYIRIGEQK